MCAASFANKRMGDIVKVETKKKNEASDERNVKLNESLQGMRSLKLYAWEQVVMDRVAPVRLREEARLKRIATLNGCMSFMMTSFPKLAVCFTLLLFVELNGSIP